MLKAARRRLLVLNALVFSFVVAIFSLLIGTTEMRQCDQQDRQKLRTIADTLISAVETPEDAEEPPEPIPDIVEPGGLRDEIKSVVTLQWFDPDYRLKATKGELPINAGFNKDFDFAIQKSPHALLLTQAAHQEGKLIGYLRVGMSLQDSDNFKRKLLSDLALGSLAAICVSALAILWLVNQALRPIEATMQKLTQFTADASHELKSPVTAIGTNADVALRYDEGMREADREKLTFIKSAADQMTKIINDLVELARSDLASEAAKDSADLCQVIHGVVADLEPLAKSRDIEVHTALRTPTLQVSLSADDSQKIFKNLLLNAIQYSSPNSSVSITADNVNLFAQIEVMDFGIGIAESELPFIFDRFWRSDKARSYQSGGNGLGLAIVRALVESNNGSIVARSRVGEGTTFTVRLPLLAD